MSEPMRQTITLCAIFRDERRYILEWVAYYRRLGFDRIVVYSNDCGDGTEELLNALAAGGILEHRLWPSRPDTSAQISAYNDAVRRCLTRWIGFFDADEFLHLTEDRSIGDFLSRFSSDVSAIAINWRVFGSAGHVTRGLAPVIERFTRASQRMNVVNRHIKSIAVAADIEKQYIHSCALRRGRYVDTSGADVELQRRGLTSRVRHDLAQINHYVVKSREEFEDKCRRGNANLAPDDSRKYTGREGPYFQRHDLNDEEDRAILARLPETLAAMAQLKALVGWVDEPVRVAPLQTCAVQPRSLVEVGSGRIVTFDSAGIPVLSNSAATCAVLLCGPYEKRVALIALPSGRVCRVDKTGALITDRTQVRGHETFHVVSAGNGLVRLRSFWGRLLCVGVDGRLDATAEEPAAANLFRLEAGTPDLQDATLRGLGTPATLMEQDPAMAWREPVRLYAAVQACRTAGQPVILRLSPGAAVRVDALHIGPELNAELLANGWLLDHYDRYFLIPPDGNWGLQDDSVDFIHNEGLLQRLDQRGQLALLAEAWRVLRPGGVHRVTLPCLKERLRQRANFTRGADGVSEAIWAGGARLLPDAKMLQDYATMIGHHRCCMTIKNVSLSPYFTKDTQPNTESEARFSYLFVELIK
jgi:hypothetical protein